MKAFNDDFGHAGGDEVLILLADASAEQAYETVGRIRRDLQSNPLSWDGSITSVSISAGVASLTDGATLEALLARADVALYEAKDAGRGRTELS